MELTENEDASPADASMQRIELLLQYYPSLLVDAEEYGGKILPRWFGKDNALPELPARRGGVEALGVGMAACERSSSS